MSKITIINYKVLFEGGDFGLHIVLKVVLIIFHFYKAFQYLK